MSCVSVRTQAAMRHSIPYLALLVAAVLLCGAAADNKCDPSSTNCAGAVNEQGARAAASTKPKVTASTQSAPAAAALPKAPAAAAKPKVAVKVGSKAAVKPRNKPGPLPLSSKIAQEGYYDPDEDEPQQGYGKYKWQQEDGLEDAPITGELQFSPTHSEDLPNYFDCEEGYVPDGFGNSVGDPSCEIVSDGVEFAYEGHSNRFTVDVEPSGLITLTDLVKKAGKNNPMVIVLTSPAFKGYSIAQVSNELTGATAVLLDDTLTITVPEIADLEAGDELEAIWKLSVCDSTVTTNDCCINGQYRRPHDVCREAEGPCDEAEYCTGHDATCPTDEVQQAGKLCRHPETFCEAPSECDGINKECTPMYKEEHTPCPWAKDCDGCTFNTTGTELKYSRTGSNPYSKGGYKSGKHETHWPVCIGKCTATGSCLMQPPAATCCREDEEAYPLEEEEDEYDAHAGSKEDHSSKKEGHGSGKYHPAQLEAGPRHARESHEPRVSIAEADQARPTTTQARRDARRKQRSERRRAARSTPKQPEQETLSWSGNTHESPSHEEPVTEPTAHSKHADKHSSKAPEPSKTAQPDNEHDFFGGKHKDTHPHPTDEEEPEYSTPQGSPHRGDGHGKDSYDKGAYGEEGYGMDSYGKDTYSKDRHSKDSHAKDSHGKDNYGKDSSHGKDSYGKDSSSYDSGKDGGYEDSSEEEQMPLSCWSGGGHDAV